MPFNSECNKTLNIGYVSFAHLHKSNGPGANENTFTSTQSFRDNVKFAVYISSYNKFPSISTFLNIQPTFCIFVDELYLCFLLVLAFLVGKYNFLIIRQHQLLFFTPWILSLFRIPYHIKTMGDPYSLYLHSRIPKLFLPFFKKLHNLTYVHFVACASSIDCCTPKLKRLNESFLRSNKIFRKLPRIWVLSNSVDLSVFNSSNPLNIIVPSHLISPSDVMSLKHHFTVGYFGGKPLERGALHILKAFNHIKNLYPSNLDHFKCLIAGFTPKELQDYARYLETYELSKYFFLLPNVNFSYIPSLINLIDVGIAFDTPSQLSRIGSSNQKIRQYSAMNKPFITGLESSSRRPRHTSIGSWINPSSVDCFMSALHWHYARKNQRTNDRSRFAACFDSESISSRRFDLIYKNNEN